MESPVVPKPTSKAMMDFFFEPFFILKLVLCGRQLEPPFAPRNGLERVLHKLVWICVGMLYWLSFGPVTFWYHVLDVLRIPCLRWYYRRYQRARGVRRIPSTAVPNNSVSSWQRTEQHFVYEINGYQVTKRAFWSCTSHTTPEEQSATNKPMPKPMEFLVLDHKPQSGLPERFVQAEIDKTTRWSLSECCFRTGQGIFHTMVTTLMMAGYHFQVYPLSWFASFTSLSTTMLACFCLIMAESFIGSVVYAMFSAMLLHRMVNECISMEKVADAKLKSNGAQGIAASSGNVEILAI